MPSTARLELWTCLAAYPATPQEMLPIEARESRESSAPPAPVAAPEACLTSIGGLWQQDEAHGLPAS